MRKRKLLLSGLAALVLSSCGYKNVQKQEFTQDPTITANYEAVTENAVSSLYLEEGLKKNLLFLGNGLHNEIILCLNGEIDENGRALVDDFDMPSHRYSKSFSADAEDCSPNTIVLWHNHYNRCYFSETDITAAINRGAYIPIQMVQVPDGYCWWTLEQIKERKNNITIELIEGQSWFKEEGED